MSGGYRTSEAARTREVALASSCSRNAPAVPFLAGCRTAGRKGVILDIEVKGSVLDIGYSPPSFL